MEQILSINNLSKHYGRIHAVDGLSLEVKKGQVYGILGPNGSGKTTTLGIVLGVINPTAGSFSWFGRPNTKEDRKHIGAVLETADFYPYLSGYDNLRIIARIKGKGEDTIIEELERVGLKDRMHSKFSTYSLGMKQRLALAGAMVGKPEVLILDEPTNGLDPRGIAEIRELIRKIAGDGITILLASHILDEVQKICSHVAVINKGKKLFDGSVAEVMAATDTIEVKAASNTLLENALREFNAVLDIKKEDDLLLVVMKEKADTYQLNEYLIEKGIVLSHLALRKKTLEKQFLEILESADK